MIAKEKKGQVFYLYGKNNEEKDKNNNGPDESCDPKEYYNKTLTPTFGENKKNRMAFNKKSQTKKPKTGNIDDNWVYLITLKPNGNQADPQSNIPKKANNEDDEQVRVVKKTDLNGMNDYYEQLVNALQTDPNSSIAMPETLNDTSSTLTVNRQYEYIEVLPLNELNLKRHNKINPPMNESKYRRVLNYANAQRKNYIRDTNKVLWDWQHKYSNMDLTASFEKDSEVEDRVRVVLGGITLDSDFARETIQVLKDLDNIYRGLYYAENVGYAYSGAEYDHNAYSTMNSSETAGLDGYMYSPDRYNLTSKFNTGTNYYHVGGDMYRAGKNFNTIGYKRGNTLFNETNIMGMFDPKLDNEQAVGILDQGRFKGQHMGSNFGTVTDSSLRVNGFNDAGSVELRMYASHNELHANHNMGKNTIGKSSNLHYPKNSVRGIDSVQYSDTPGAQFGQYGNLPLAIQVAQTHNLSNNHGLVALQNTVHKSTTDINSINNTSANNNNDTRGSSGERGKTALKLNEKISYTNPDMLRPGSNSFSDEMPLSCLLNHHMNSNTNLANTAARGVTNTQLASRAHEVDIVLEPVEHNTSPKRPKTCAGLFKNDAGPVPSIQPTKNENAHCTCGNNDSSNTRRHGSYRHTDTNARESVNGINAHPYLSETNLPTRVTNQANGIRTNLSTISDLQKPRSHAKALTEIPFTFSLQQSASPLPETMKPPGELFLSKRSTRIADEKQSNSVYCQSPVYASTHNLTASPARGESCIGSLKKRRVISLHTLQ
ncbi:hypothetical protein AX774_g216 [Zancudomyces culisetae]|uniref:Uncharacterized protein n=1 Tax=Zancudomyces culisetae TaxID=1213189 RepID=A0A1R1PZF3_ZANCU|nr:hypothetical protein AX774_g216 [Zancudomyces culisetae]|eukprot:OMH86324.1 hypothetical protein AX774_g216 [Zancudomyces culisetae]